MEYLVEIFEENIRIVNSFLKDEPKKIENEKKSEQVIEKKKTGFFSFFS